jgi:NAD(P)-dependent dehydrogenase (short-subunit alcohol dehydrogenase family)
MAGDVREESFCRGLVERAVREFGGLDIVVNNAAYQMARESIADVTAEELERTNIFAMYYTCRAALEHTQPGSTIINAASVQAYKPDPVLLDYAATKAAIVNFTTHWARRRPRTASASTPWHRGPYGRR